MNRKIYIKKIMTPRPKNVHKKKLGQILLIVGSRTMPGAGILSVLGSLRSGAGLTIAAYPQELRTVIVKAVPEAIHLNLSQTSTGSLALGSYNAIIKATKNIDAIVIGPGLAEHPQTGKLIIKLVKNISQPLIIDASALNVLSKLSDVSKLLKKRKYLTILTPHEGEMAMLTGLSSKEISSKRKLLALKMARLWNVIMILKGPHTIIASPDKKIIINNTGGPGLATAGSGDVLAGIVATLVAQNLDRAFMASAAAVQLHGLAGDMATQALGEKSVIASDVLEYLPKAILKVEHS